MKYCGIMRPLNVSRVVTTKNVFNANGEPYQSLGDKILSAIHYGSDVGTPAVVQYDKETTDQVDILTDPNHDFFDIAEQYGQEYVNPAPAPASGNEEKTE